MGVLEPENGFSILIHGTVLDRGSGYPVCSSMVFRSGLLAGRAQQGWMDYSTYMSRPREKMHRGLLMTLVLYLLVPEYHVFRVTSDVAIQSGEEKHRLYGRHH